MSNKLDVSNKARNIAAHNALNMEAKELHDALFQNQWEVLESDELLEPNYLMIIAKEKFYKRGGDSLKAYTVSEYSKLMDLPTEVVSKWVETKPEFFVWLHQKRTFDQEVNSILLVMSRSLFNDFKKTTSLRDKSQAINSLKQFSSLMSPKKETVDEVDKMLDGVTELSQITEIMESYGFVKKEDIDTFNEDRINIDRPLEEDDELLSLEEIVSNDE